ncbi:AAA family ATPase [Marinobacter sp. NSM]|uniref:AAA family ATPase n=1 Tax=Marinobacter sp. NSM TaxID=3458004 RepID=UPI0040368759
MSDTIICVADDVGVRVWLERVLEPDWNLELVSSSDLSRVSRLVQATGAAVVIVAIDENEASRALKVFSAVQKSCPEAHLVGVSQRISQDLLLNIMRAGARDCLITGVDADSARERVARVASVAAPARGASSRAINSNITIVTAASPVVDTRFFGQNFVHELSESQKDKSILALDSGSDPNRTFYFDNLNRLTLNDLVSRGDNVDRTFVETALEEFSPGLRLLSGQLDSKALEGDAGADLYITITQLASLFDHLVIRVEADHLGGWLRALGSDVSNIMLLTHPAVDQIQSSDDIIKHASDWVSERCRVFVIVDGFEKKSNLSLSDAEKTLGRSCDLLIPIEWRYRLDAINAGIPISLLPAKTQYEKSLRSFVRKQFIEKEKGFSSLILKRASA